MTVIVKTIKCPHCNQDVELPAEMVEAASSWFNRRNKSAERMRRKRQDNPGYGQRKK